MANNFQHSRRAVYRVVYPVLERPSFLAAGESFSVIDCSELGLRYQVRDVHRPDVGATVTGFVRFRRGVDAAVTGEVIRVENGTVAVWFRGQGPSVAEMMQERHYLEAANHAGESPQ